MLESIQTELQEQMMTQLAEKLVDAGAAKGFSFTAEDVREVYKTMSEKRDHTNPSGELSDNNLDGVVGGMYNFIPPGNGQITDAIN